MTLAPDLGQFWDTSKFLRFAAAYFLCGLILTGGVLVVPMLISVRLAAVLMNHLTLSELLLAPFVLGVVCIPLLWRRHLSLNNAGRGS